MNQITGHVPNFWKKTVIFLTLVLILAVSLFCGCRGNFAGSAPGETGGYYVSDSGPSDSNAARCQERFSDFCLQVFCDEVSGNTLDLHYTLKHPEIWGISRREPFLGSCSLTEMVSASGDIRDTLEQLTSFDRELLTEDQKLVFDVFKDTLETSLLSEGMELYYQPLSPSIGTQAQLPVLLSEYSFDSLEDVEDYLGILSQMDSYYSQILEFENQKADAGLGPSDASIDGIVESCRSYLVDPEDNFLTETFQTRLDSLEGITDDKKAELSSRHIQIIQEHFIPAYQLLIDGMTALRGRGLHEEGLASYKDGKKYYEYLLKSGTGTSYTIPELKKALASRMEKDLEAISEIYLNNPDFDPGASSFALTDPTEILEDLKQQMRKDFPALPECSYEIKYVPGHLEDTLSPAFYLTAPLDDLDQNVIYINNGYSDSTEDLYTTLAHEGFPGHLYQTVYSRSHSSSPLLSILSNSGANEGWATYVENYACTLNNGLSEEAGIYRACMRSFSLCLHGLLDIGINYDGWSREQAGAFITTYFEAGDDVVEELWQTMIDNPTNYLEYCNGYVELMEMREMAEAELGPSFSAMEFHRFLLDLGPVPYSVTREYFARWLDAG